MMKKMFVGMMLVSTIAFSGVVLAVPSPIGEVIEGDGSPAKKLNDETEKETEKETGVEEGDETTKKNLSSANESGYVVDGISPKTGDVNLATFGIAGLTLVGAAWAANSRRRNA